MALKPTMNGQSTKDVAEVIIAKHRNGPVTTVRTRFINRFAKFENLDEMGASDSYDQLAGSEQKQTIDLQNATIQSQR
jgi:hypothetical protein